MFDSVVMQCILILWVIFPEFVNAVKKNPLWFFQGGFSALRTAGCGGQILEEGGEYQIPDPKAGTDSMCHLG